MGQIILFLLLFLQAKLSSERLGMYFYDKWGVKDAVSCDLEKPKCKKNSPSTPTMGGPQEDTVTCQ